jgi:hypothetical protein
LHCSASWPSAAVFAQQNSLTFTSLSAAITVDANLVRHRLRNQRRRALSPASLARLHLYVVDPGQTVGEKMLVIAISSTTVTVKAHDNAKPHVSGAQVIVG